MTPRIIHLDPATMHTNPAFTQAVTVQGDVCTIYVGGQNAVAADGQIVGEGDLAAQVEQVLANLGTLLSGTGG